VNWILLAVGAQFLNALVAIIDKRVVSDDKILPKPFVYAFYTCLISGAWIIVYFISLIPISFWGIPVPSFEHVFRPTLEVVALSFLAAYTFFIGLVSMFTAFRTADASDVVPVVGATSAIASFGLGYFFLYTPLSSNFALGIALLSIGTFLVSHFHFPVKTALISIHSGIFFALHYVAIKGLFMVTTFDDGFFWSRIAFMFFALSLLMVPHYFEIIKKQTKATSRHAGLLIFANKVLAGVSTLLILKATHLGDVAVVQALGGLQFVFILFIGIFFTLSPRKIKVGEVYHHETILQKALFVAIIALGFLVLFK
jgi:drug/metabolite transporter (DMT)-like permease